MAEENVEVIRSLYAEFSELAGGGDVAPYVAKHFHPECEYEPIEEMDTVRGHKALVRWNERWFEVWDEVRSDPDELLEAGDSVVFAAITLYGRAQASGTEITGSFFHVFEFRDGKVLRMGEFDERGPALEAAGLNETA